MSSRNENHSYAPVAFELLAFRKPEKAEKHLFVYERSERRLASIGLRHPCPHEIAGLAIDGLEGKLSPQHQAIFADVMKEPGEWLAMIAERRNNKLVCYEKPAGVTSDEKRFYCSGYSGKYTFSVKGLPWFELIPLKDIDRDLVRVFYGVPFNRLPAQIQTCGGIMLPDSGFAFPVSWNGFSQYSFDAVCHDARASRGVREYAAK